MSTTEDLEVALRYALANQDNGTKIGTNAAPSRAFLLRFLVKVTDSSAKLNALASAGRCC
jgi:hypothetical protein